MPLEEEYSELLNPPVIQPTRTKNELVTPAGFGGGIANKKSEVQSKQVPDLELLKNRKIWEIATGPAKSIPMNLIMSYMTGNSLQMIPIMMTLMLFWNPLKAIFTETNIMFKGLETEKNGSTIFQAKIVFILCQIGCMSIGIWKLNKMGLIPNSEADWLSFKIPAQVNDKVRLLN